MRKLSKLAIVALMLCEAAGCQSAKCKTTVTRYGDTGDVVYETALDSVTELGKAYYAQPNTAKVIEVEGTNLTFSVSGATRFCLSTPVPTKSIMPKDKSWMDSLGDTLKTVAPWFFMAYWVHEGGFGSSTSNSSTTTTTNNN